VALCGCARNAPELPVETSQDATARQAALHQTPQRSSAAACEELSQKLADLANEDKQLDQAINKDRAKNQVAYIFSAFVLPVVALDNHEDIKAKLDENQKTRDQLILAQKTKGCSAVN